MQRHNSTLPDKEGCMPATVCLEAAQINDELGIFPTGNGRRTRSVSPTPLNGVPEHDNKSLRYDVARRCREEASSITT